METKDNLEEVERIMPEKIMFTLLLDFYNCQNGAFLTDKEKLNLFIEDLVKKVDMKPLGAPKVIKAKDSDGDYGYTILRGIYDSALTIHSFYLRRQLNLIIQSCKEFDKNTVIRELKDKVCPDIFNVKFLIQNLEGIKEGK